MFNRRQFFACAISLVLAASSAARNPRGSQLTGPPANQPFGTNLAVIGYFTQNYPFIDLMKMASNDHNNNPYTNWITLNSGGSEVTEEQLLPLDSDGYPTSLTGSSYGGTFTQVQVILRNGDVLPPNATQLYCANGTNFTVTWSGIGTLSITGDATTGSQSTSGFNFTVTTATSAGLTLHLTATGSGSNHLTNLHVVPTSQLSAFNSGQIFRTEFIAAMANFYSLRSMDWTHTLNELTGFITAGTALTGVVITGTTGQFSTTSTAPAVGATVTITGTNGGGGSILPYSSGTIYVVTATGSGTFTLQNTNASTAISTTTGTPSGLTFTATPLIATGAGSLTAATTWTRPTGTYPIFWTDGTQDMASFTYNSASITYTSGPGIAIKPPLSTLGGQFYYAPRANWANRSLPSNAFWTVLDKGGVPYEVIINLINSANTYAGGNTAQWHVNMPIFSIATSQNYISNFSALALSGTGAQIGGALNSGVNLEVEYGNENWNAANHLFYAAGELGNVQFPSTLMQGNYNYAFNTTWRGYATATMAAAFATAWGSSFSRVIPILGTSIAGTGGGSDIALQMAANGWSGGPASNYSLYPIKQITFAPYFGGNGNTGAASISTWNFTATGTSGQNTIVWSGTFPPSNYVLYNGTAGDGLSGTGIGTGAQITNINYGTNTITLSVVNSGTVSGTITADDTVLLHNQSDGGLTLYFGSLTTGKLASLDRTYNTQANHGAAGSLLDDVLYTMQVFAGITGTYPNQQLAAYESGNTAGSSGGPNNGVNGGPAYNLITMYAAAQRDSRMKAVQRQYDAYWLTTIGTSKFNVMHQYYDIGNNGGNNDNWGSADSLYQPLGNGAVNAPPKWQALLDDIYHTNY